MNIEEIKNETKDPGKIIPEKAKDENEVKKIVIENGLTENEDIVKFSRKYEFEGKVYDSADMSGLEDTSAETAAKIEALYRRISTSYSTQPETTLEYAIAAASIVTGLPAEFFKQVGFKDIVKIKNRIINFLYSD